VLSQSCPYGVNPRTRAAGDIFDHDPPGPEFLNDAEILEPEAASSTSKASSLAGAGNVLTRETSAEHVDV
jgi:hypothetical protein